MRAVLPHGAARDRRARARARHLRAHSAKPRHDALWPIVLVHAPGCSRLSRNGSGRTMRLCSTKSGFADDTATSAARAAGAAQSALATVHIRQRPKRLMARGRFCGLIARSSAPSPPETVAGRRRRPGAGRRSAFHDARFRRCHAARPATWRQPPRARGRREYRRLARSRRRAEQHAVPAIAPG